MKSAKLCPVFRKTGRKVSSHLRHMAVGAGMSGTKSFLFRAGRYSIHQFFRSFAALFTALLIIPKAVNKAFNSALKGDHHGVGFGSGITGAIKGAFMGIPSLIRSGYAAFKVQLYGVAATTYHFVETIKASFAVLTGRFGHFNEVVHHAFSAMTANLKAFIKAISLMFSHFTQYVAGVFQNFKTGTSNAVHTLWEKEKTWGTHMYEHFDYVSKGLSHILSVFSAAFAKVWGFLTSFGGGFKHKVEDIAVTVGHKVHDTAANAGSKAKVVVVDVGHKMHDAAVDVGHVFQKVHDKASNVRHKVHDSAVSVHEKAADVRHKIHDVAVHGIHSVGDAEHRVFVKVRTTANMVRAKASDLATGVRVGTVQIYHKVKDGVPVMGERAVLILKTSTGRGKHLLLVGVARARAGGKIAVVQVKTTLSKGSQDLVRFFGAIGKKTNQIFAVVTRPFVYPFIYISQLPGRTIHTMHVTPVTVYLYLLSVCGLISYLGFSIKSRYDREMYARKVGIHKKMRALVSIQTS